MLQNHDLLNEFPHKKEEIHQLKISNNHFKNLFEDYHEINAEIHRLETGAEIASDEVLTNLRKKRLFLKDELLAMLDTHLN